MKKNLKNNKGPARNAFSIANAGGYAILETLFYISLFAILSIAVIDALITMTKAFKETTTQSELMQGGNMMEKISREIRQANDVRILNENDIELDSIDSNGDNRTIEFKFSASNIEFIENNTLIDNLNTANIAVVDLNFRQINTTKGVAVKVRLTVKSNHDLLGRNESFYDTVVLRGKY
jgi:hypothetical protein